MIEEVARRLRENIQKVIIGKDEMIELTQVAVLCEGHLLLEDVPGIGKTTLARALAASLGCTFRRIQFTPDLLPSDVTVLNWFNQKEQAFEFRPGPIISHVVLADEINRATPRTQSALLEAMQERQITVDGVTRPFLFVLPLLIERLQGASNAAGKLLRALEELQRMAFGLAIEISDFLERYGLSLVLPRLKTILLWGIVILVALLAVVSLTRWLNRSRDTKDEDRQSILEKGDLWDILRQSLQDRLRQIGDGLASLAGLRHGHRLLAAARIRRIYAQLMEMSERLGDPRPVAQTPLEFLPTLEDAFPGRGIDLEDITRAYLRVRYGELPETRQEVDQVEEAWERVRVQGLEQLNNNKKKV